MQSPHFIVNRQRVEDIKKKLSKINVSEEGWGVEYEDIENGEKWIEYRVEPEYYGVGYPMLAKQPEPNIDELIQIALESENLDEVAGVSVFLFTNEENNKIDFREKLIDAIETFYKGKKETSVNWKRKN